MSRAIQPTRSLAVAALTAGLALIASTARADCNFIPTTVLELGWVQANLQGSVDRPYADPGQEVVLRGAGGSLAARVTHDPGLREDTVSIPGGYGAGVDLGGLRITPGALVDSGRRDPFTGIASVSGAPVSVESR